MQFMKMIEKIMFNVSPAGKCLVQAWKTEIKLLNYSLAFTNHSGFENSNITVGTVSSELPTAVTVPVFS